MKIYFYQQTNDGTKQSVFIGEISDEPKADPKIRSLTQMILATGQTTYASHSLTQQSETFV